MAKFHLLSLHCCLLLLIQRLLFLKECAEDEVRKVAEPRTASSIRSTPGNTRKGAFHLGEVRSKRKLIKAQICI